MTGTRTSNFVSSARYPPSRLSRNDDTPAKFPPNAAQNVGHRSTSLHGTLTPTDECGERESLYKASTAWQSTTPLNQTHRSIRPQSIYLYHTPHHEKTDQRCGAPMGRISLSVVGSHATRHVRPLPDHNPVAPVRMDGCHFTIISSSCPTSSQKRQ